MAKPTFCAFDGSAIAVLMPMTRPCESTSGPPELPGLIAASVWITSPRKPRSPVWRSRCKPETIPRVTLRPPSSASALPIATTSSPTCTWSESPSSMVGKARALDLEHGEVAARRGAEHLGGELLPVGEVRLDLVGAFDDVVVRDDDAVGGHDEARCRPRRRCPGLRRRRWRRPRERRPSGSRRCHRSTRSGRTAARSRCWPVAPARCWRRRRRAPRTSPSRRAHRRRRPRARPRAPERPTRRRRSPPVPAASASAGATFGGLGDRGRRRWGEERPGRRRGVDR